MERAAVVSLGEVARDESHPCLAPPLELVERLGIRTWLARAAGRLVVARWLGEPAVLRPRALPKVFARQAALPFLVPVLGTLERDGTLWLVSELDGGVSLRRLLQVAKLSAPQARVVAAQLVGAVEAMHAAGFVHGRVHASNLQVGLAGEVRLTDWAVRVLTSPPQRAALKQADLRAAAVLAAQLTGNRELAADDAGGLGAHTGGDPGEPGRGRRSEGGSRGAVTSEARSRTPVPSPPGGLPPLVSVPAATAVSHRRRRRLVRRLRAAGSSVGKVAVTVALLALVVGGEFVLFSDRLARNIEVLRGGPAGRAGVVPAAPARRAALPAFPLSAGPVVAVQLRALDPCRRGERCRLLVDARVQPHPTPLRPSWRFRVLNDCTGLQMTFPAGGGSLQPGIDRLVRLHPVALPARPPLEVVAVTSEPAVVASRALHLPGRPGC